MKIAKWIAAALLAATLGEAGAAGIVDKLFIQSGAGAVPRKHDEKLAEVQVSIKDFGAKCDWDGATGTDDTSAIQKAINAVSAAGGGIVSLPPAACMFSAVTTYDNVSIEGRGTRASRLVTATAGAAILYQTAAPNTYSRWGAHLAHFKVASINAANADGGIVLSGASQGYIDDVHVEGFKYGLVLDQTTLIDVKNSEFVS
jgi:polygalacturonase